MLLQKVKADLTTLAWDLFIAFYLEAAAFGAADLISGTVFVGGVRGSAGEDVPRLYIRSRSVS